MFIISTRLVSQKQKTSSMDEEKTLTALREWAAEQTAIPEISDKDLQLFADCVAGDLENAKRVLFNYYTIRVSAFANLFDGRDIDNETLSNIRSVFQTFMVPVRTPENYQVLISHAVTSDTKLYDMMAQMRYLLMTLEASLVDAEPSSGHVIVFDISTLSTGHILKFSPSGIKKTSNYLQEGIPLKIKNVYLVNASPLVDMMMKTAKPFLNMDLLKRTYIYKSADIEKLYEHVPKECLPEEYGGLLGPSAKLNDENTEKLRRLKGKFLQEEEVLKSLKEASEENDA